MVVVFALRRSQRWARGCALVCADARMGASRIDVPAPMPPAVHCDAWLPPTLGDVRLLSTVTLERTNTHTVAALRQPQTGRPCASGACFRLATPGTCQPSSSATAGRAQTPCMTTMSQPHHLLPFPATPARLAPAAFGGLQGGVARSGAPTCCFVKAAEVVAQARARATRGWALRAAHRHAWCRCGHRLRPPPNQRCPRLALERAPCTQLVTSLRAAHAPCHAHVTMQCAPGWARAVPSSPELPPASCPHSCCCAAAAA